MTQQDIQPNQFTFSGSGVTITYQITEDGTPVVSYQDGQSTLTFVDQDVRRQETEIGTLVSVSLKKSVDAGATIVTLVVPPINLGGQNQQTFDTFYVTTQSYGILPRVGARLSYQVQNVQGTAQVVPIS